MICTKLRSYLIVLILIITFSSCKTNKIRNNERHGKWIDYDTIENINYKSIGRYKNGLEKGTHRQFSDKKLHRKEKYKDGICQTTYYYPNGRMMSEGNSELEITEKEMHWYYQGDWKFYDEQGNLLGINTYEKGELVNQTEIKQ